ncbi:MAG: prepilin peptidase [Catenulispora sp.]
MSETSEMSGMDVRTPVEAGLLQAEWVADGETGPLETEIVESEPTTAEAADGAGAKPERPAWQPVVAKWRIPIAVTTLALEAGILLRLGPHWTTLPVLAFAATAVVLAVIDFAILRLPNALTLATALAVAGSLVLEALADKHTHQLVTEIEGGLGVGLFYLLLYALSRGGLGSGDVKLGAVAGLVLASRDWVHVFNGTFLAYVLTLTVALTMMTRGRKRFPYGPGLIAGTIIVLLLAP